MAGQGAPGEEERLFLLDGVTDIVAFKLNFTKFFEEDIKKSQVKENYIYEKRV